MTDGLIRSFMVTRRPSSTTPRRIHHESQVWSVPFSFVDDRRDAGHCCGRRPRCRPRSLGRRFRRSHRPEHARAFPVTTRCAGALVNARGQDNGGFDLDMWGAVVNRDGIVCAVAFTGTDRGKQWPGSRVIAAQKANTANAFSLPNLVALDRESVGGGAARRLTVRPAAQQSGQHECRVRGSGELSSARTTIRWSASASAA